MICDDSVTDCLGLPTQGWGPFLIADVFRHRPVALCWLLSCACLKVRFIRWVGSMEAIYGGVPS